MSSRLIGTSLLSVMLIAPLVFVVMAAAQPGPQTLAGITAMVDKNEFGPALAELDPMIAREPSNGGAYAQRARVRYLQKKFTEARADAEKALAINARDAVALNIRGLCDFEAKDYQAAIRNFSAALSADPQFLKALRNRAVARGDNNEPLDAVLRDFDAFLTANPTDVGTLQLAGNQCLRWTAAPARCAAYFEKIKTLRPASFIGYLGSAMAYANVYATVTDKSVLTGAVTNDFKKAIELEPRNSVPHLQYGRLLLNLGDHAAAIASFTKTLELDPKHTWALAMRGDCYRLTGKQNEAIADYKRSLEIEPSQPLVYRFLGESLRAMGRFAEMLTAYQQAVERDPYNRDAYERLSAGYYLNTDWIPKGQAYYEGLVAKNPRNVCALEALGRLYGGDRSKELLDRAIDGFDGKNGRTCSAEAAFWLGRVHAEQYGKQGIAMDYYEKALQIDPDLPNVRNWMSQISRPSGPGTQQVAASVKAAQNRQAYVDRTYLNASNDIKSRSDKFNAYNTESQNILDTTLARRAELKRLMISEMTEIVGIAKRTMSDVGSEISQSGRDYLNRIITTGTQRLESLNR